MAVRIRSFLAVSLGGVERQASGRAGAFEPMVANDGWVESRCQGRQPPQAVAAGQPLQRLSAQPSLHRGSMAWMRNSVVADARAVRPGSRASGRSAECCPECERMQCGNSTRRTSTAACVDQTPCRMFLCVRCRCQVLVCRRFDRGQLYCAGTYAQKARRDRQREISAPLSGNSAGAGDARRAKS
jgi:hypothetical protein